MDEWEKARLSRDARRRRPPRPDDEGSPAFVGRITSTGASLAAGKYCLVRPARIFGAEAEGGAGSFLDFGPSTPVYLLGAGTPATGDYLVCRWEGNRWAAERGRNAGGPPYGGMGSIPNCACPSIPNNLTMTSADLACNYRMFQSCEILGGPTPAKFAPLNLGPYTWLSTQSFPDPIADGAKFYYYLTCRFNQFTLTRVYLESPFGSPYRDGILYTWLVGGYGNACSPFRLDGGQAFPGSDLTCSVKIDG